MLIDLFYCYVILLMCISSWNFRSNIDWLSFCDICLASWVVAVACLWTCIWLGEWEVYGIWSKSSRNSSAVWKVRQIFHSIILYTLHKDYLLGWCLWIVLFLSGLKISVKVLSLMFQAGLAGKCPLFHSILFRNNCFIFFCFATQNWPARLESHTSVPLSIIYFLVC